MRILWQAAAAAAIMAGVFAVPARADSFSIGLGGGGVSFSYDSGGYCDRFGCPDGYWDLPVYDCPVFWGGDWYRGPVYYRRYNGRVMYWIHGDWRYDQWRGARPGGVCVDRYRPALGFEFYERNGFHIRDDWRQRWYRDHGRRDNNGWDRHDDRRDNGWNDRRDNGRDDHRDGNNRRDNNQHNNAQNNNGQGNRGGAWLPGMQPPGNQPGNRPAEGNRPNPAAQNTPNPGNNAGPGGNPHARGNWMAQPNKPAAAPANQPAANPPAANPPNQPARDQNRDGHRGGEGRPDHNKPNQN